MHSAAYACPISFSSEQTDMVPPKDAGEKNDNQIDTERLEDQSNSQAWHLQKTMLRNPMTN